jgi:hypothetical protein
MSYIRTNTAPTFGSRAQAIWPSASRLGAYLRSSFPLPTTSMSRPIGRLGSFWEGPYTHYPQPRALSGEWTPQQPPPRALYAQGALTYRIDPRTGQYRFYSTDILPRGVWQQNTFQHPVRPALSALGVQVQGRGQQLVQVGRRNVVMKTTPACSSSCSQCKCGGRCRGLGAQDAFSTECSLDSDCGPNAVCGGGWCYSTGSPSKQPTAGADSDGTIRVPMPVATASYTDVSGNTIVVGSNGQVVQVPNAGVGGWFSGSTRIAGTNIPNAALAVGALVLVSAISGGGRRR